LKSNWSLRYVAKRQYDNKCLLDVLDTTVAYSGMTMAIQNHSSHIVIFTVRTDGMEE